MEKKHIKLLEAFSSLADPRVERAQRHSAGDILFIAITTIVQGQLHLYATSLKVADILLPNFYSITRLDPTGNQKGYQRLLNEARAKRFARYIVDAQDTQDAFLPTSIFLATEKDIPYDKNYHTVEIDTKFYSNRKKLVGSDNKLITKNRVS